MQIVIAWTEEDQVVVKQGRIDIGERHVFKTVPKPMACMWMNDGTERDLNAARAYALKNGYRVFSYTGAIDPLGNARSDVLRNQT